MLKIRSLLVMLAVVAGLHVNGQVTTGGYLNVDQMSLVPVGADSLANARFMSGDWFRSSCTVRPFEVSFMAGWNRPFMPTSESKAVGVPQFGVDYTDRYEPIAGFNLDVDFRYNLAKSPLAFGYRTGLLNIQRYDRELPTDGCPCSDHKSMGWNNVVYCEYDIRRGYHFSPFVSLGVGAAYIKATRCSETIRRWHPLVQPSVGIELFNHIRVAGWTILSDREIFSMGWSVGFVLGGDPRKASKQ